MDNGWTHACKYVCVCLHACVDGWVDGWMAVWLAGWMDGWLDGRRLHGWMDDWIECVCVYACTYVTCICNVCSNVRYANAKTSGMVLACIGGWMDGWMVFCLSKAWYSHASVDGWMRAWACMDGLLSVCLSICLPVCTRVRMYACMYVHTTYAGRCVCMHACMYECRCMPAQAY